MSQTLSSVSSTRGDRWPPPHSALGVASGGDGNCWAHDVHFPFPGLTALCHLVLSVLNHRFISFVSFCCYFRQGDETQALAGEEARTSCLKSPKLGFNS